jgi:hypothetical protein
LGKCPSAAKDKKKYPLDLKTKKRGNLQKWAIFFYQQKSVDSELEKVEY